MLIGIMGKMGSGKTLSMTILAQYIKKLTESPLWANYTLKNSEKINTLSEIWKIENGIICLDEIWLTMDARLWNDNVMMTRWINQTRKKKLIVMYTTQHIRQVEMRVRNATDFLIYCQKMKGGRTKLTFIDYQYNTIGKSFIIEDPRIFYNLYDTYEVLQPIINDMRKETEKTTRQPRSSYKKTYYGDSKKYKSE